MTTKDAQAPEPVEGEPNMAHLGRTIRSSRDGRMTVEELSEISGVSGGLISQLERGIGNPSFNTLMRLSRALDIHISALFHGEDYDPSRIVVRSDERRRLMSEGLQQELLTPDGNRRLGVVRTIVPPGYSSEDTPLIHKGEEAFFVTSGELEVWLAGREYVVKEGDTISFDASLPHGFANRTNEPTIFIGASTPPASARYY